MRSFSMRKEKPRAGGMDAGPVQGMLWMTDELGDCRHPS